MRSPTALLAVALVALVLGGCGSDSAPDSPPRAEETLEELPPLAPGWKRHVNSSGGFVLGLPPGWEARNRGTATLVSAFDRLAVVSISADRTREALSLPLEDFATRALTARPGYESALEPSEPREFDHHYEGVIAEAEGTAGGSGVDQRVELIVLRRSGLVTLTVVIAINARPEGAASGLLAERMIDTLRSRPVGSGV